MVPKKVDADISHLMKLAKKRLGARTESEAIRMIFRGDDKAKALDLAALLVDAQSAARLYGQTEES